MTRDKTSRSPLMSTSVGSGGILNVTRQVKLKGAPANIEISPDGSRNTSGTGKDLKSGKKGRWGKREYLKREGEGKGEKERENGRGNWS